MASRQAIQAAIQAAADAGAVQGYVQALDEVNKNLLAQQQAYGDVIAKGGDDTLAAEERFNLLCEVGVEVDKELERRKTEAQAALARANAMMTAASVGPGTRARWWLARILGGAAQRLSRP